MQKTAIVVPCYNESQRIDSHAFSSFAAINKDIYFLFVNDGSTDNTQTLLDALCKTNPERIRVLKIKNNCGKAEAVRQGILKAIQADFELIGFWDADLSTPLAAIGQLCDRFNGEHISIVMGSRVKILGCHIKRRLLRHYLGRIFASLASFVLKLPVYDTQCGAKLFRNNDEFKKVFSFPFSVNWIFDVEILARYTLVKKYLGHRPLLETAVEYPLKKWTDIPNSKVKYTDFLVAIFELLKICLFLYLPHPAKKYLRK